jgi:hypothetical protein
MDKGSPEVLGMVVNLGSGTVRRASEAGSALLPAVGLAAVALVLVLATLSSVRANVAHQTGAERDIVSDYVLNGAVHRALAELNSGQDPTGNGLGALGIVRPETFRDPSGRAVGEYRAVVVLQSGVQILKVVAAVPSFGRPEATKAVELQLAARTESILTPNPGAISISGPLRSPQLTSMASSRVQFDGGNGPAIVLTSTSARDNLVSRIRSEITAGRLAESDFRGIPLTTFGTHRLPVAVNGDVLLTAAQMNSYRESFRTAVLSLASRANRTITAPVTGNQTWGTAAAPQVTTIDVSRFPSSAGSSLSAKADRVFDTAGQTITGHGTLIIQHPVRPRKNLNLNWTGNVYVVGFSGDASATDDLFYGFGLSGTINGNMVLLGSGGTEASLELARSSSSYVSSGSTRDSNLTVTGSLLCFAEATSHESEIEMEGSSRLTVYGMTGMYGSRIELETSGSSASVNIAGTLVGGLPSDNRRNDDFLLHSAGSWNISYDPDRVAAAIVGIEGMETSLGLQADLAERITVFSVAGVVGGRGRPGGSLVASIDALIASRGQTADFGWTTP